MNNALGHTKLSTHPPAPRPPTSLPATSPTATGPLTMSAWVTQALAWGRPRPEYMGLVADDGLIEQDRQTTICWRPRRPLRLHPDGQDGSPGPIINEFGWALP